MNKKFILPVIVLVAALFIGVVVSEVVIRKISDRVINRLKREYTPGPYSPGFDADKLNPNYMQNPQSLPENQKTQWNEDMWEKSRN
jgi:hypothetical protein